MVARPQDILIALRRDASERYLLINYYINNISEAFDTIVGCLLVSSFIEFC